MPDSSALDVLIGLALLFAAFSLAVSRLNEAVLGLLNYRGRRLEAELRRLLGGRAAGGPQPGPDGHAGADLASELLDGPLRALRTAGDDNGSANMADHPPARGGWAAVRRARRLRLPSYVPSTVFAQALVDRVDPPARAMLTQLRPQTLPDQTSADDRSRYEAAYEAATRVLNGTTAEALYDALPADHAAGRVIAAALVAAVGSAAVGTLEEGLAAMPPSLAKNALTAAVVRTGGDREKIIAELAKWYDQAMDRLSGWYKRRVAVFLLCYALALSAAFNLDAIGIARALWQDGTVRQAAVTASQVVQSAPARADGSAGTGDPRAGDATESQAADATEEAIRAVRSASGLALPIGWIRATDDRDDPREVPRSVERWLVKILGIAIACFALTAGAPFWFELLGRLVNMRSTGPKPRSATSS
ncbi:hypothetical protein [Frankia sp. AgB32]|uniref:hypothetical protein n=1 Tax=Frankia sp. AgB32 TaxID=631119 RepID=UPI00200E31D7|nr:hypothetical protein [Frankia sp. AgB32]MCK9895851.1 hypothetical protein [Frankia sp. AgB32]